MQVFISVSPFFEKEDSILLLPREIQTVLSKYFLTCWNCGLTATGKNEDVCPICGSTGWGWRSRGIGPPGILIILGFILGEVAGTVLALILTGTGRIIPVAVFGILTIFGPIHRIWSRKTGQDWDVEAFQILVVGIFLPSFLLSLPIFFAPMIVNYFSFCGVIWAICIYDIFLYSNRKSHPIDEIIHTIEMKHSKLELNLVRVREELVRLESGRKNKVILELVSKLRDGEELIRQETSQLSADHRYTKYLRLFFLWRNSLFNIYTWVSRFTCEDLEQIDAMNKNLRLEILEVREYLKEGPQNCRKGAGELRDFIEKTLNIHEIVRDVIQARIASHVLGDVDLLERYEIPLASAPFVITNFETTINEILDQVNVHFFKIQADADANKVFRS